MPNIIEVRGLDDLISYLCRFKFDDERVTKEDTRRALEEQYGGEEEVYAFTSVSLLHQLNSSVIVF